MPRYVAFLRGVSPLNAKMPEVKRCFEQAGFSNVKTVLSSGNVVFDARTSKEATLERKTEAAMQAALGRSFQTFVRSVDSLRARPARPGVHGAARKDFRAAITTRTWDTVRKCVAA